MTKEEAIQAMKQGKKVRHPYFSDGEWMTMEKHKIVLEDGVRCYPDEFWRFRYSDGWEDGYELVETTPIQ